MWYTNYRSTTQEVNSMSKSMRFSFRAILFPQINPHFEDWEMFIECLKKRSLLNFTHAWHSNILPLELIVALSIDSKVQFPYHSFPFSFLFPFLLSFLLCFHPRFQPACLSDFLLFLFSYIILLSGIEFSEEYCILKVCWYFSIQISQDLESPSKSMIRYINSEDFW